jgi:hypothetical protein
MATSTRKRRPSEANPQGVTNEEGNDAQRTTGPELKAGLAGSGGLLIILLISLLPIPQPFGSCLVIMGFSVIWVGTGMLAGILAENVVQTRPQAVRTGATAGFVSGIGGGIAGMIVAAFGALFPDLGAGILAQFSPSQVEALGQVGIAPDAISIAGSVLSAMLACGMGGTAVSIILGSLGGRIYFRLR